MEIHDTEKLTKSYLLDPDNIDVVLQFPKAHTTGIWNMVITEDSKWMFSSDYSGNAKSWDVKNGHVLIDYGKMNKSILVSLEPKMDVGQDKPLSRKTDMAAYGRGRGNTLDSML